MGYWRLGGISEGKVVDFAVNGNDGKVYSDPYVGAMTLNRKLGDNTTDAVKYSNSELFAVSQRATYQESFEFKVNSTTAVNLAYLNNADGRNLGTKIFTLSYWGKTSRSAEEKKPITTFVQNVFEDVGGGWFRVSATVTIPDGVSMLRSFEIANVTGSWTSLEIRKHRIRLLSDSITEAKYTDSLSLSTLANAYAQLPQQLKTLELKEQQEATLLKEKLELESKISLWEDQAATRSKRDIVQLEVNNLTAQKNDLQIEYNRQLNSPFNYMCRIKSKNNRYVAHWSSREYALCADSVDLYSTPNEYLWAFESTGDYYHIKSKNDRYVGHWRSRDYKLCADSVDLTSKPDDYLWAFESTGDYYHIKSKNNRYVGHWRSREYALCADSVDLYSTPNDYLWTLEPTTTTTNNNISNALASLNQKTSQLQQKQQELNLLTSVLSISEVEKNQWQEQLRNVNSQLQTVQDELNTANNSVINTLKNVNAQPQEMPSITTDGKGLVTKGAILGFVQPGSRLNAIETCEGNVQLSYFDTQGRMQQTNYDATADANNTAFEQWIPNSLRACLNLTNNNSQIQLTNPIYLGEEWTVETWFSFPPNGELIRALNSIQLTEKQKLQASDKEASDYFGKSVAISGNYAIVGANSEDTGAINAGAAYVFERNSSGTWTQIQKHQASQ